MTRRGRQEQEMSMGIEPGGGVRGAAQCCQDMVLVGDKERGWDQVRAGMVRDQDNRTKWREIESVLVPSST